MALDLKKAKKNSSGNNRNFGSNNIPVVISEVVMADPNKVNADKDYAIGWLLAPFAGVEPTFDEHGNPTTSFKIKMSEKKNPAVERPEIYHLQEGKKIGIGAPVAAQSLVVLERAYLDRRSDMIVANWYKIAKRDLANTHEDCVTSGLVSVDGYKEFDGNVRQSRYAAFPQYAETFKGVEDFKAKGAKFLQHSEEMGGGRPCFWVRVIDNESFTGPDAENTMVAASFYVGRDSEGNDLSPEESIDALLNSSDETRVAWKSYIEASAEEDPQYTFEIIPFQSFSTGLKSIEGKKKKNQDDSIAFRMEDGASSTGFAMGSMITKRDPDKPDMLTFFATDTYIINRFDPIFPREELITPNMQDHVRDYVFDKVQAAAQKRIENVKNRNSDNAPDQDGPSGEPDHSAGQSRGLTPN